VLLIGNSTVYATVNSTTYSGTSSNATNLNSQAASYYLDAGNMNAGTLGNARLSSAVVNTSAAFTLLGNTTFSGNTIINGTNNVFGTMFTVGASPGAVGNSVSANTTVLLIGNSTVYATINSTAISGLTVPTGSIPSSYVNTYNTNFTLTGTLTFSNTAASGNAISGAITTTGGIGVGNNLYVAGRVGWSNSTNISTVYQYYNQTTDSLDTVFG
jgi:hypothetical protein